MTMLRTLKIGLLAALAFLTLAAPAGAVTRVANGTQLPSQPSIKATTGTPGYFGQTSDGGAAPTVVDRDWLNEIQESLIDPVLTSGQSLNGADNTQLTQAIRVLAGQAIGYADDTGAANAYVIAPTPALTAYAEGVIYRVKFANANTGAATLNVSSLGTQAITHLDGSALVGNEIVAGMEGLLTFDGTNFQLLNPYVPVGRFVSSAQSISAGYNYISLAHGLGAKPFGVSVVLRCVTAQYGYSPGDEVQMPATTYNGGSGGPSYSIWSTWSNATNVGVSFYQIYIIGPSGTGNFITPANWTIVIRAWL